MNNTKLDKMQLLFLLDLYGGLLTDNQRKMLSLFYENDCTLGEIAEESGVSRQAVHDAVIKGEAVLINTEAKLGIYKRMQKIKLKATELLNETKNNEKLTLLLKEIVSLTEG